ncbi:uncharacterized protein LOC126686166 [Mercurialis annua]|uniref:uncharacterized protein LOC126686166 n=1 Tax=Mercurialis annua TaxID=3986 RepID=UPI00215F39C1|nr:uncharacterized protein LOC126686166 [Mercurialis annua]
MENEDLIIGDNQDSLLRQNQYLESGDIHNSDFAHIINDHHNFDADHTDVSIDYIQDLGLGHTHETSDEPADSKAIVVQNHSNGGEDESHLASENHDSAVVEYRDFCQNDELSMMPVSDGTYQMPLAVRSSSVPYFKPVELTVGQEFPDVHSCRRAFRDAAIAFRFEMHTIKSDKTRFTAKCATEGCPWRIHAAKLPGLPTFTIRTIHEEHTCGGIRHLGHQQASVQWVAESVETHLLENPHSTPKEILEEIYRAHGITLSYKQAWRAKERVMASVRGSFEEEYRLLPQYCDQIVRTNPGSIAVVYGNPVDDCFERLFISFQASIYGFLNACRHLIVLDRTLLKSKYHGTLLFATGFDGDGAVFPLAFGLVDDENVDNWMWFHSELHNLLEANTENMPKLTILSDRQNGIIDGVEANFPTAFHGFCINQLIDRFVQDFNSVPSNLVWEAATALTPTEFGQKMLVIENMSQQAVYWLRCIDPRLWAVAYFEGTILAQFAPNLSESLNTLILETSGLPVIQMMEHIRRKLMTWFSDRREMSLQWTGMLVPSAERQVFEAIKLARSCQVVKANDAEFEVSCNNFASHTVDIRCRTCSCRGWQLRGLPCVHGVAALISCGQNVYKYTEDVFTVANYRKAYSQAIHPIPDKAFWNEEYSDDVEIAIRPPKSLQPLPGKPRKKRVRAEDGGGRVKRAVHCSRCHQTGHFRTTCAVPI